MKTYHVEKLGGIAGFGVPTARIRSIGEIEEDLIPLKEQELLQNLFHPEHELKFPKNCDEFLYRIIKKENGIDRSIEVPESFVPEAIRNCVRDEFV